MDIVLGCFFLLNYTAHDTQRSAGLKRLGEGFGGRARALLDLANKRTNDTRFNGTKFHACEMCVYGLSCCPFGHDTDTACYYYYYTGHRYVLGSGWLLDSVEIMTVYA